MELQPEHGSFWVQRGGAYADGGQWDKASADFVAATSWSRLTSDQSVDETLAYGEIPTLLGYSYGGDSSSNCHSLCFSPGVFQSVNPHCE